MGKKISPKDNQADQRNANRGMTGVNKPYAKAQGNRGKQMNGRVKK
ncbi:hypothetical protein EZS27_038944 [termite gut metagenome]|uniref:Uncharacterized protein n=1 Tax=termite gut metagenome TaxID=433724 RepID=A0A5J4PJ41_9ZZZZ